ncbi:ferrochelatase [Alteromonadaceae bacterium 2753L.S.0a.02]|nr:ferrochelatase [Alteromonadaceae bacterium 2753L.S.0a.02]
MNYQGQIFDHRQPAKTGVLLVNLGTPEAPTAAALKTYLKEFLSDPRVVEIPRLLWWLILRGIILNVRPKKSAAAYAKVWASQGSPLAIYTRAQAHQLAMQLNRDYNEQIIVAWAMRYGKPAIGTTLQNLLDQGVRQLLVLPLYPQYSAATTGSTFDALAKDFIKRRWLPGLRFVNSYHDHPHYIQALTSHIKNHWQAHGKAEKLIFSYHGVPLRYLHNGDPYHCQCLKTTRLVAERLGLGDDEYVTSFQSRFGREAWLQPYTDETLKSLPGQGVKAVQVICPGFAADCLETLEEIAQENRHVFLEAGGEHYEYIAALNDSAEHMALLKELVYENLQGWQLTPESPEQLQRRAERANACQHNQKS